MPELSKMIFAYKHICNCNFLKTKAERILWKLYIFVLFQRYSKSQFSYVFSYMKLYSDLKYVTL